MVDRLSGDLVAECVNLWQVFNVFSLRSGSVVEELESLLIEIRCVKAPENVLEVESAAPLIDQHHS